MAEHWSLLVLVIAVAAGLVAVTVSAVLVRSRQTALFRYFLVQVLLFNLLILGGLVLRYLEVQLGAAGAEPRPSLLPGVLPGLLGALGALKLGWLGSFIAMTRVLPGRELPAGFGRRWATGLAVFFAAWGAGLAVGVATGSAGTVLGALLLMEVAVIGGAAGASFHLLVRIRSRPAGPRRRAVSVLGALYLGVFVLMLGSLAAGTVPPAVPMPSLFLFNGAVMVLYNLAPLPWILRLQPAGAVSGEAAMERFGISPREREIIDLIRTGRTNREIADRLFISLATVKDHNYNIFRKTGVRNRVELANLFRGDDESSRGQ